MWWLVLGGRGIPVLDQTPLACLPLAAPARARLPGCPAGIAHQVQLVQQLMDHWERVLPGRVLQVRYCDLVRDQVRQG